VKREVKLLASVEPTDANLLAAFRSSRAYARTSISATAPIELPLNRILNTSQTIHADRISGKLSSVCSRTLLPLLVLMAPPGAIPPGYSYEGIPQSYMARRPVPEGEDSNTRAYVIFFSYLALCASLTIFIIQRLLKSYAVLSKSTTARKPPKKHVLIFVFLATASLATTWYHMFQYFRWSYTVWSTWRSFYTLDPDHLHWGLWLRQTSLFREAWETAITAYSRYWWTHQIFFFACGLGLDLEMNGIDPRLC
jgi:hypothetical protein